MKYRSDILETLHESATEKFKIGAISEERMHEYDKECLVPETAADAASANPKTKKIERAGLFTA